MDFKYVGEFGWNGRKSCYLLVFGEVIAEGDRKGYGRRARFLQLTA